VSIDGREYRAHRLSWLYVCGEWPPRDIDHWDMDRSNNRWTNLRLATPGQNNANVPVRATNQLGVKGVRQMSSGNFQARIIVAGKLHHIGTFTSIAEASAAYAAAAVEAWGEYARV